MFNYNKLLEVEKINLEPLDNVTLIDWNILDLGSDAEGLENWICIEVFEDENNAVKILEQNEYETEEISERLSKEQKNHIYKLVKESMKSIGQKAN